jgi:methionyl-tRNA formyltransferase
MRIIYGAYRNWALEIYEEIKKLPHEFLLITSEKDLIYEKCKDFEPDIFLFYGWSWMVKKEFLDLAPCVCLHPSPLPKYRGGSPIQNQIIRGEKTSAVTLFYMTEKLDAGDIILQEKISLEGHLQDILDRITKKAIKLTKEMLNGKLDAIPQDESKVTFFDRRKPHKSELKSEVFNNKSAEELYNFIRALEDPYPNAFIRCKDGKKLLFKRVEISKE